MRKAVIAATLWLLVAVPGFPAEQEIEVLGGGDAPVRLSPVAVEAASSSPVGPGAARDFRVKFLLENTSDHTLTSIGVEAVLYAPTGELRGFHDFTIPVRLKPHTAGHYILYRSGKLRARGDERIVLIPLLAKGRGYRWQAEGGGDANCDSLCSSQEDRCANKCPCGMNTFSCTCSPDGSLSISCSCFQCPVPQG